MVEKEYALEFRPDAEQDLKNLDRSVAQRLLNRLRWLTENFDSIAPEQLSGKDFRGIFKFRVGDYRILYTVHRTRRALSIHRIGHRSEIYRN
jgi:mRNA interferase RelE/StbE